MREKTFDHCNNNSHCEEESFNQMHTTVSLHLTEVIHTIHDYLSLETTTFTHFSILRTTHNHLSCLFFFHYFHYYTDSRTTDTDTLKIDLHCLSTFFPAFSPFTLSLSLSLSAPLTHPCKASNTFLLIIRVTLVLLSAPLIRRFPFSSTRLAFAATVCPFSH